MSGATSIWNQLNRLDSLLTELRRKIGYMLGQTEPVDPSQRFFDSLVRDVEAQKHG